MKFMLQENISSKQKEISQLQQAKEVADVDTKKVDVIRTKI